MRVHALQAAKREQIDVGRIEKSEHERDAADRIDVEQRPAEERLQQSVQDAGARRRHHLPAQRADDAGEVERDHVERVEHPPERHVGARHQPGQGDPDAAGKDDGEHADDQRIRDGIDDVGSGEDLLDLGDRQAGAFREGLDDNGEQRIEHRDRQDRIDQDDGHGAAAVQPRRA